MSVSPIYLTYILAVSLNVEFNIKRGNNMSFRPKNGEKEVISFRIPKAMLSEIDRIAVDNALSRNEFMLQCLEFALDNLDESPSDE